jgi:hypothetical protein
VTKHINVRLKCDLTKYIPNLVEGSEDILFKQVEFGIEYQIGLLEWVFQKKVPWMYFGNPLKLLMRNI